MRILWASEFSDDDPNPAAVLAQLGHDVKQVPFNASGEGAVLKPLAEFREAARRLLDAEIAAFDPHVIHCPAVWVLGQLALESGVPYTLAAGDEIDALAEQAEIAELAQQATENAGRIFVRDEAMRSQIINQFGLDNERVIVLPRESTTDYAARLASEFRAMLVERFGNMPE